MANDNIELKSLIKTLEKRVTRLEKYIKPRRSPGIDRDDLFDEAEKQFGNMSELLLLSSSVD